jgi:pilus assembly protein CpaB
VFGQGILNPAPEATPTPPLVSIVIAGQPINRDDEIKPEALSSMPFPQDKLTEKLVTNPDQVVGKYAVYPIAQNVPITLDMVADRPGLNQPGSEAAKVISPGLVAITIPLNWQSSVGYSIRDGDRVNIIATTLFVDVDSNFQSELPNNTAVVTGTGFIPDSLPVLTAGVAAGGPQGRAELDPTLNQALYILPSEKQRPRLVSQMILQDIQVLHVGEFVLQGAEPQPSAPPAEGQPTPVPTPVTRPDIITLIVSPQDAVALTYLLYGGAKFTLTLRAPDDNTRVETEAATLQYILSQYAIPVPAKLPYAIQPRMDTLPEPVTVIGTPTPSP